MSTRLERLVQNITDVPERIAGQCAEAMNALPPPPKIITEWEIYRGFLASVYCQLECRVLGISKRAPDVWMDCGRCWRLLRRKFGEAAPQACFEIVRTGVEGGVAGMLRTVAELFAEDYSQNLVNMAVEAYFQNRSVDGLLSDAKEYAAAYRHILPSEIAEGGAVRIAANFRKVLKQHPTIVRKLRRIGART